MPAGPLLDLAEVLRHPQTLAREMVVDVPHRRLETVRTLGCPVKFGGEPVELARGAPVLGEHTAEVLAEYRFADAEVAELVDAGAVLVP